MGLILVDVEATGISPHGGVMTEFGAVEFKSRATYHGVLWASEPDPDNPAKPRLKERQRPEHGQFEHEHDVMSGLEDWLRRVTKGRPILVSDNPAYDFMWVAYYFDKTLGRNPFGHSGRRIADFYAGLHRDFYQTQKWKSLRVTPHDHNPVNDAMGNAEALEALMHVAESDRCPGCVPGSGLRHADWCYLS